MGNQKEQYQLDSRFFGLTLTNSAEYRKNLFTQIHNIVYHGNGGYDFGTIYNMPIWIRKFTFKQIDDYIKDVNKKTQQAQKGGKKNLLNPKTGKISAPKFNKSNPKKFLKRSSYK